MIDAPRPRWVRSVHGVALVAAALMVVVLSVALGTGNAESGSQVAGCPVTVPAKREVPPGAGFTAAGFNYGNAGLRAHLSWPQGTLVAGTLPDGGSMAVINPDGSIGVKLGWWRRVPGGKLVITGRRLDKLAPPLRAHVSDAYRSNWTPSSLTFPAAGCWRVTGTVGRASLTFVVKVRKLSSG